MSLIRKILITCRNPHVADSLCYALQNYMHTLACSDGRDLSALMAAFQPDILMMDLALPKIDALAFLDTVAQERQIPRLLVTSAFTSPWLEDTLAHLNVDLLVLLPWRQSAMLARIYQLDIPRDAADELQALRHKINDILLFLGLRPELFGYRCILEAVTILACAPEGKRMTQVYPQVAEICESHGASVEKAIRICISDAFKKRNHGMWALHFPDESNRSNMTNSHFLTVLADHAAKSMELYSL